MSNALPKATHQGKLMIGDFKINCAVVLVDDKPIRVVSERSISGALGIKGGGAYWEKKRSDKSADILPEYISAKYLSRFIDNNLMERFSSAITYTAINKMVASGVEATVLPDICNVWIQAEKEGALSSAQQLETAKRAYILMRGFATIGIIALVDEATGYQRQRPRDALQKILDKYLSEEWAKWTRTFELEFYEELFRVRGIPYDPENMKRPSYVGHWTNDLVYSRLAPGVLTRLRELNPRLDSGNRARKHFQYLTQDFGYQELQKHLHTLTVLLRLAKSNSWRRFISDLNRVLPPINDMFELPLEGEEDQ